MHIFQPDNIFKHNLEDTEESYEYYTTSDTAEYYDNDLARTSQDSKDVYAKKVIRTNGSIKYMIKLDKNAKLYNPFAVTGPDKPNDTFLNNVCRDKKFKEVNEKAFNFYVNFLTSKNPSLLFNAEREVY